MPVDPAATPLDSHQLAVEQDRERRAWLARADADARRHRAAAEALADGAARPWSPATPGLAVLCVVVVPACLALYTWAFSWLPLDRVPAVIPAVLLLTLLVNVGLVDVWSDQDSPTGGHANPGRVAITVVLSVASCLLLASSAQAQTAGQRVWLGVIGLLAGGCLVAMPRHLVALAARGRAARHRRRADQALEDAAFLATPFPSPVAGTVGVDTTE